MTMPKTEGKEKKKKRFKKLSKEEKKKAWSKPESNNGCGWGSVENDYRYYQGAMKKKKSIEV